MNRSSENTSPVEERVTEPKYCGEKIFKSEILFYLQNIILYITIISCILNLSFNNNDNKLNEVWKGILWYSLGRLFPIKNERMGGVSQKNIL